MVHVRHAVIIQVAGLLTVGSCLLLLSRVYPVADLLASVQGHVMRWGVWSAICYPLLYAACNVLLLPGGFLSLGGGFFFGLWWGFLIVLVGNVCGAAMAFYISRSIGNRWLQKRLMQNPTLEALQPAVEREGWKLILLSQLHPLFPTSLLNYLYGLTTVRFKTCMLWVAIGQAPGLFLYVYVGTLGQLGLRLARGETHPRGIEYLIWGGGLVLAVALLAMLGRIALRLIKEAEESGKETNDIGVSVEARPCVNENVKIHRL